jgi:hypothetical protein
LSAVIVSPDGSVKALFHQYDVANAAGSGNGVAVTTPISFPNQAPAPDYSVHVTPSQPCFVSVTGKTSSGFNVVLTPTLSSVTLAAGKFDLHIIA